MSTGGGVTAAVGVGVGTGACWAGTTGVFTPGGVSPGSGVGAALALVAAVLSAVGVPELVLFATTIATMPTTTMSTTTAIPIAAIRRRR